MTRLLPLLLLFSSALLARDPFSPVSATCGGQIHFVSQWRLLGVLGSEGRMISRWYSPTGRGVSLEQQAWPGEPGWRISEISLSSVTLSGPGSCQPLHYRYSLKKERSDAKKKMGSRHITAGGVSKGG